MALLFNNLTECTKWMKSLNFKNTAWFTCFFITCKLKKSTICKWSIACWYQYIDSILNDHNFDKSNRRHQHDKFCLQIVPCTFQMQTLGLEMAFQVHFTHSTGMSQYLVLLFSWSTWVHVEKSEHFHIHWIRLVQTQKWSKSTHLRLTSQ